jgi:secondary thiamine-phosphate synthase enzyme
VIYSESISITTGGRGFADITEKVQNLVRKTGVNEGLCNVFLHHTSASLILCENADPDVRRDLETFFSRLVPDGDRMFVHTAEGPDDMPAHVRAALTGNSLSIPVAGGRCDLGTWQGIYLYEHRTRGHRRRVTVTVVA